MSHQEPGELVVPKSVAVIMDGNGRWAKQAGFERIRGHEKGIDAVRTTVTECARLGVGELTLYAFSTENWKRPEREVELLFGLLRRYLIDEKEQQKTQLGALRAPKLRYGSGLYAIFRKTCVFTASNCVLEKGRN